MERRLLLDVVIGKGAVILQLLSRKNQTLLVRWSPDLPRVSSQGGLYLKPYQVC